MDQGDLRKVDLHTHIAASHHDAVRRVQDLRKIADALLIFDFGDDPHPGAGLVQHVPQFPHICGRTDKAGCHIVEPLLRTEEEIVPVLLAHVGHIQPHTGDIDPLVVLHITVIFHPAADLRLAGLQNGQPHQAVVQQDGIPCLDVTGQFSVGDGTAVRIALHLNGGQGEFLTGGQMDPSTGKVLQTNLRALSIQHGRHRGVQLFPQRLQRVQPRLMLRVGPVGKVEAGHVHSCPDHLPQDAFPVRGGAKGTYNLCLSHLTHSFRHFKRNADSLPL